MKRFYIKERYNPQLGTYWVAHGQISKAEAKRWEKPGYGANLMHAFDTEADYKAQLELLRKSGERVQ